MQDNEPQILLKTLDKIVDHIILQIYQITKRLDLIQHPEPEKLMNANETQAYLHISKPTLLKYIKQGSLKAHKIGKSYIIPTSEIQRFIKEGRVTKK